MTGPFDGACGAKDCHAQVRHYHGQGLTISTEGFQQGSAARATLPAEAKARKDLPIFSGFVMYFPDIFPEVAKVSKLGNDKHNPGQPLHWAREKSNDHMDCAIRHMLDHATGQTIDPEDGTHHLAKAIWRLCAELQLTIEKERNGYKGAIRTEG